MIEGKSSAGFVNTFFSVRHATPAATGQSLTSQAAFRSRPAEPGSAKR